jgi:prepilin-type N-terminal cleavage/methylation domain-containing protein
MKRGFSLIEFIIAMAIASGLALLLFNSLNQSTQTLKMVESIATVDINVVSFYDRFERDISGAFIPVIGDPDLADRTFMQRLEKQQKDALAKQNAQAQGAGGQAKAPQVNIKPEKPVSLRDIQLKKPFVYEEEGQNLKTFSFITCNPFAVYGPAKPRMARVSYTLKHDPIDKDNYALWRRQSDKLAFESDKESREYVIMRHIKSLRLELLAPPQKDENKKDEEQDPKQQQQEKLAVYKMWPAHKEEKKQEESKPGDKPALVEKIDDLPRAVKFYLDYEDPIEQQVKKYEFMFAIVCYKAPSPAVLNVSLIHEQRVDQQKKQAEKQRAAEQQQTPKPGGQL